MAAKLDFILMASAWMRLEELLKTHEELASDKLVVKEIHAIRDWTWQGARALSSLPEAEREAEQGNIVWIDLESSIWGRCGMYLEACDELYTYSFWLDTEKHPELDFDSITKANCRYYCTFLRQFQSFAEKYPSCIRYFAIGVEADVAPQKTASATIEESGNVVVWYIKNKEDVPAFCNLFQKRIVLKDGSVFLMKSTYENLQ